MGIPNGRVRGRVRGFCLMSIKISILQAEENSRGDGEDSTIIWIHFMPPNYTLKRQDSNFYIYFITVKKSRGK